MDINKTIFEFHTNEREDIFKNPLFLIIFFFGLIFFINMSICF